MHVCAQPCEERFRVDDEFVREKDISFFNMRATDSVVRMTTSEEAIEALLSCGHFMGSAEAPKLFARAHERPITEWFQGTKHLSKELKAVGLDGNLRDISLGAFADDVFRKLVWDVQDEEGVRRVLDVSDQALDEALTSGGWVRNESKRELVLGPSWEGSCAHDARRTVERPYRGIRSAPGQPVQLEWKEWKRAYAALEGMGRFLTSTTRWGLRRTAFLGAVVGAMTSGAETYNWSCAELRKMDVMICRFLRVLLMEKACDVEARNGWTNEEVLVYWRVAPMRVEIAVRRSSWLQAMSKAPQEHTQFTNAAWGTMPREWTASADGQIQWQSKRRGSRSAVALVLDLAKAVERVSLPVVWACATHFSFPRKILRVLCGYFEHRRRVQFEGCVA